MAKKFGRLVTKLYERLRAFRTNDAPVTPHGFAKGEFAGRRRSTDR